MYIFLYYFYDFIKKNKDGLFKNVNSKNIVLNYFHFPIKASQTTVHLHIKSKLKVKNIRQIATNYLDRVEDISSPLLEQVYLEKIKMYDPDRFSYDYESFKKQSCI